MSPLAIYTIIIQLSYGERLGSIIIINEIVSKNTLLILMKQRNNVFGMKFTTFNVEMKILYTLENKTHSVLEVHSKESECLCSFPWLSSVHLKNRNFE